ncbi:MAG: rRNA pseudouridine synthase [Spirochaetes bacterium]|nr:rRNA pseudouridine synthase [Spirochaetota bacterium]
MRINRFLAGCGIGSRRKMDEFVLSGRVSLNGKILNEPGVIVNPKKDVVSVDGREVRLEKEKSAYILNKPKGYITSMSDPHGEKIVKTLIEHIDIRLFPVGRLDRDSQGLLLFTNDGKLCHRLSHPRYGIEKEYLVTSAGKIDDEKKQMLESGIILEEGITSPAKVTNITQKDNKVNFHIIIHEGWNRQIRRMCDAVGLNVIMLKRVRYGFLGIRGINEGTLRKLTDKELKELRKMVGL